MKETTLHVSIFYGSKFILLQIINLFKLFCKLIESEIVLIRAYNFASLPKSSTFKLSSNLMLSNSIQKHFANTKIF